ncbi:MAG: heme-binding domain-containing protein [Saprospiraceae bacterium]
MKKRMKSILMGLLAVLVVIQFIQIDKTNPEYNAANDFMNIEQPPAEVAEVLKNACYDCHSYETKYPWYTYVQPVGWWVKNHIKEGVKHLNYSKWGEYTAKRKDHKLEEMVEMVEEGEMPLNSYTWGHPEARLTKEQRDALINWFKEVRNRLGYAGGDEGESHRESGEEEHEEHEHD